LQVFDFQFQIVFNLLIGIVHLAVYLQDIAGFIAGRPEDNIRALINEGDQPLNQVVDKTVFVQVIGFLHRAVEHLGGMNLAAFVAGDKLGVLAQVAHAFGGDFPRQLHGHKLLRAGDKPPGVFCDAVEGIQAFFNRGEPALIHYLVEHLVVLSERIGTCLDNLKQIPEIPVVFQCTAYAVYIF